MDLTTVIIIVGMVAALFMDTSKITDIIKNFVNPAKPDPTPTPEPEPAPEPTPTPEPVVPTPTPMPTPDEDSNSVVDLVAGWNCFRKQCDNAALEEVVAKLDEIFPMLIEVEYTYVVEGEIDEE